MRRVADQKAKQRISFGHGDACGRERPKPTQRRIPSERPARLRLTPSIETLGLTPLRFNVSPIPFATLRSMSNLATQREIGSSMTDAIPSPAPTMDRSLWILDAPNATHGAVRIWRPWRDRSRGIFQ